jgi:AraC-like DNA-binding protein
MANNARPYVVAMVRVGPWMSLPAVLRDFGVDPGEVLAEFGVAPEAFSDPENSLPFVTVGRLLSRCVERTGCRHFSLLLAQKMSLSGLGAIGLMMQSAPSVGAALEALGHYLHLHDRGAAVTLAVEGRRALLSYALEVDGIESADQVLDFSMVSGCTIMRTLCGADWSPIEVRFAHEKPRDLAPFRKAFPCPLRFNARVTAVAFDPKWLDAPVAGADPLMHRFMKERVEDLEASLEEDVVGEVRRLVRGSIADPKLSLDKLAAQLSLTTRTLNRRLRESGTSYAKVLEEVRRSVACQYLAMTHLPVGRIAPMLGYSDVSAFSRAFTRWFGAGPAAWRAGHREDAGPPSSSPGPGS